MSSHKVFYDQETRDEVSQMDLDTSSVSEY